MTLRRAGNRRTACPRVGTSAPEAARSKVRDTWAIARAIAARAKAAPASRRSPATRSLALAVFFLDLYPQLSRRRPRCPLRPCRAGPSGSGAAGRGARRPDARWPLVGPCSSPRRLGPGPRAGSAPGLLRPGRSERRNQQARAIVGRSVVGRSVVGRSVVLELCRRPAWALRARKSDRGVLPAQNHSSGRQGGLTTRQLGDWISQPRHRFL
jgi:hypothetical protein